MVFEDVRNSIIEYIRQHGRASWKELLTNLNIPKATLYRNLKKLESAGIIKKDSRGVYVLVDKAYVTLVPAYASQICALIECDDVEKLTADLMSIGNAIEAIEKTRIEFIERYTEIVKSLDLIGLIEPLFKGLYSHRGFFVVMLYELAKIQRGLDTILSCDRCEAFSICPKLKDIVNAMDFTKTMNIPRDVFEDAIKVGEILRRHNYKGTINIKLMGISTSINYKQLIFISISSFPLQTEILKLYSFIVDLTLSYYETGCRSLGEKELKELKELCKIFK